MAPVSAIAEMVRQDGVLTPEHDWTPTGWEAKFVRPFDGELDEWRAISFGDLERPLRDEPTVYGLAVEDWSPDGEPLVVDQLLGRRVPAASIDGFVRLVPTGRLISTLPAEPGWIVEVDTVDQSTVVPVHAWMVDASGYMRPVVEGVMSFGRFIENEGNLQALSPMHTLQVTAPSTSPKIVR